MRFIKVTISNFRHHKWTEIEFEDGLTAIVGPNGSGKTTFLEAIVWALFGSRAARTKTDDLINDRGDRNAQTWVKFTFGIERAGKEIIYTVTREPGGASLAMDGSPVTEGSTATTEYVEQKVLGMTYDEWINSLFTTQKGVDWMSGKGKAERERFLSTLLGHGRLKDAQKTTRERSRDLSSKITAYEAIIGDQTEESLNEAIEQAKRSHKAAEADVALTAARIKMLQEEEDEIEKRMSEFARLESEVNRLLSEKREADAAVNQLHKMVMDGVKWFDSVGTKDDLEAKLAVALAEQDTFRRQRRELEVSIDDGHADEAAAKATIADREPILQSLLAERAPLNARLSLLSARLKEFEDVDGHEVCPTCKRPLDESFEELVEDVRNEINDLGPHIARLDTQIADVGEVLGEAKERTRHAHLVRATETATLNAADLQLKNISDTIVRCQRDISEWDRVKKKHDELKEDRDAAAKRVDEIKAEGQALGFNRDAMTVAETRARAVKSGLRQARDKQASEQGILSTKAAAIQAATGNLERLRTTLASISNLRSEIVTVEATARMFGDLRTYLNEQIRPDVSAFATELVGEMSNGAFDELILDEDYVPRPYQYGKPVKLTSGGEADVCSLAVRLAISRIVAGRSGTPVDVVVLDEVFAHLDRERRRLLVETIKKLAGTRFRQVFMVTHDTEVTNLVDRVIEVGLSADGDSVVSFAHKHAHP